MRPLRQGHGSKDGLMNSLRAILDDFPSVLLLCSVLGMVIAAVSLLLTH